MANNHNGFGDRPTENKTIGGLKNDKHVPIE